MPLHKLQVVCRGVQTWLCEVNQRLTVGSCDVELWAVVSVSSHVCASINVHSKHQYTPTTTTTPLS